jgi:hypothetical protein
LYLAGLLRAERIRRGTRAATRCLGCFKQAVLVRRWFLDNTRLAQLAGDNAIGKSTAYDYLHEGIDVLPAQRPDLHTALHPVSVPLTGVGMLVNGVAVVRARLWRGWQRLAPTLCGRAQPKEKWSLSPSFSMMTWLLPGCRSLAMSSTRPSNRSISSSPE